MTGRKSIRVSQQTQSSFQVKTESSLNQRPLGQTPSRTPNAIIEPDKYRGSRVVLVNQLSTQQIKIMVPGNSLLELGDHIQILVPRADPIDKMEPVWFDERMSGVYTITAIRHDIDTNEYTNTLELSRSAVPLEYPSEGKFLGRGQNDTTVQGVLL